MERLTRPTVEDGCYSSDAKREDLINALAKYEDTDLTAEEIENYLTWRRTWRNPAPIGKMVHVRVHIPEWVTEQEEVIPEEYKYAVGFLTGDDGEWMIWDLEYRELAKATEHYPRKAVLDKAELIVIAWRPIL